MKSLQELNQPLPNGVAPGAPQPVSAPMQGGMLQAPTPKYVPGVGMMGADLGGSVKGAMLRQDYDVRNREDNRAERDQAIQEEDQTFKRTAIQREQAIQTGMVQAAQQGGYGGVIDYLQSADPERALKFTAEKNELDQSLMKTDIMKAAVPAQLAKIQIEAYGTLGKMGTALLQAPPEDRQGMYENMLPMIKQINPDAPNSLDNKAVGMFMLAQAQATPENILYNADKQIRTTNTEMGKAIQDLTNAKQKYGEGSQQVKLLQGEVDKLTNNMSDSQLRMAETLSNNKIQGEDRMRQQWLTQTKNFTVQQQSYNNIMASNSGSNPNGVDDLATIFNYMKMLDPTSAIMAGDYANAENTKGIDQTVVQTYNKVKRGEKLSPEQRANFLNSAKTLYNSQLTTYNKLKDGMTSIAVNRGYDPNSVTVDVTNDQGQKYNQKDIEYTAQKYNMTPDQVRAKLSGGQ